MALRLGMVLLSFVVGTGCGPGHGGPVTADTAGTAEPAKGPDFGEVMVGVGRRFEICGKAAVARRFELAEFEAGELLETFEDDVPHAQLPKEGPTSHIPAMAEAFRKTALPELQAAAKAHDAAAFDQAYAHASASCNGCHAASAKGFIEVPSVPGKSVPVTDPVPSPKGG
jgi:hypothetical protein